MCIRDSHYIFILTNSKSCVSTFCRAAVTFKAMYLQLTAELFAVLLKHSVKLFIQLAVAYNNYLIRRISLYIQAFKALSEKMCIRDRMILTIPSATYHVSLPAVPHAVSVEAIFV